MKASEIQMDETLPHGTKEGYAAGCHGSHCPGREALGMTCSQANIRYASDYSYKRRIDGGLSPQAIAAEDALDGFVAPTAATRRRDLQSVPSVTVADSETPVDEHQDDDAVKAAAIAHAESTGIPYEKHGTTAGYSAGCRDKTGCPGIERVYKSCTQAVAEYQRSLKDRKRAEQGASSPEKEQEPTAAGEVVEAASELEVTRQRDAEAAKVDGLVGRINELESILSDREIDLQDARGIIARLQEQLITSAMELDVAKVSPMPARAAAIGVSVRPSGSGGVEVQSDGAGPLRLNIQFAEGRLADVSVVAGV